MARQSGWLYRLVRAQLAAAQMPEAMIIKQLADQRIKPKSNVRTISYVI
jgi:hypothetical protein